MTFAHMASTIVAKLRKLPRPKGPRLLCRRAQLQLPNASKFGINGFNHRHRFERNAKVDHFHTHGHSLLGCRNIPEL